MLLPTCVCLASAAAPTIVQSFDAEVFLSLHPTLDPIELVDMDGDGFKDILFTDLGGTFRIGWAENDGSGAFLKSRFLTKYPGVGGAFPNAASAGDLDGDGDPDLLVIAQLSNPGRFELGWFMNLGEEQFGTFQMIAPTSGGFGGKPNARALDLDADGDLDALFCVDDGGPTWVENLGNGSFAAPVDLAPIGERIQRFETHDLDHDGRPDIVWNRRFGNEVSWVRNLGGGNFASPVAFTPNPTGNFAVTDFDSDGLLDVLITESTGLLWLQNLGAGTFGAPALLAASVLASEMIAGDFDGDGLGDVVTWGPTSNSPAYLYRNSGTGAVLPRVDLGSETSSLAQLLSEDVDADGDLDIVVSSSALQWHENVGALGPTQGRPISRIVTGALADIDGDGDLDCIGTDYDANAVVQFTNRSDAQFSPAAVLLSNSPNPTGVDLADSDGDGDLDLLVSSGSLTPNAAEARIYRRVGAGYGSGQQVFPANTDNDGDVDASWLDMDGDGDLDVLMIYSKPLAADDRSLVWARNDGPSGFAAMPSDALPLLESLSEVVDLDGDGLADIVGKFTSSAELSFRPGQANGTFGSPISTGITLSSASNVELVDLDGDLNLDVLFLQGATDEARASFQVSPGSFGPSQTLLALPQTGFGIGAADWDLDGDLDPVVSVASGFNAPSSLLIVIENLGGGTFGGTTSFETGSFPGRTFGADVDGDQDIDLWRGPFFDGFGLLLNDLRFGDAYCGNGSPNSTGEIAKISATGSPDIALNDVTLLASSIPRFAFGYFLLGDEVSFIPAAGGSQGTLCIGGTIGRLNRGPNEVFQAGLSGEVAVALDLANLPAAMGSTAVLPGDTRYFQAWHRDANPTATSNFSTGLAIQFN